jgi:hypothetical protein
MRWRVPVFVLATAILATTATAGPTDHGRDRADKALWPYPLAPVPGINPVLTASDVTDSPAAFVADPFLIHKDGLWYMFFEVWTGWGVISVATSVDGHDWTYDRVVLREDHHISYPCVFGYDDGSGEQYYMVVESSANQTVPLYKSVSFPYQWSRVAILASGREFADPTIFRWNGTWWMFVSRASNDACYLYYSDHLESGWLEHPRSPIASGRGVSRPAGRTMVIDGTRVLRLAQKCDIQYGEAVRVFEVDALTRTAYAEHEIPDSPILGASGQGWNAEGMHQCDECWTGTSWLAAVDGFAAGSWSIGIYARAGDPAEVGPTASGPPPLRAYPNPLRTGQEVRLVFGGGEANRVVNLDITDAGGRVVRRFSPREQIADWGSNGSPFSFSWVTEDDDGRPLTPGVYFVRATTERPDASQDTKIVVTR